MSMHHRVRVSPRAIKQKHDHQPVPIKYVGTGLRSIGGRFELTLFDMRSPKRLTTISQLLAAGISEPGCAFDHQWARLGEPWQRKIFYGLIRSLAVRGIDPDSLLTALRQVLETRHDGAHWPTIGDDLT
jgi:hypothetical protein